MLKIIIGFLIVAACTIIGANYSDIQKKKEEFFFYLGDFNARLIMNLSYKKENVKRILEEEKYALFKNIYEKGQSGRTENVFPNYLNDEQKKIVSEYFLNVGKGATKAEEDFLEYQSKIISEQLEICKFERAKNKNIGEKLGFGVGLAVFILIL